MALHPNTTRAAARRIVRDGSPQFMRNRVDADATAEVARDMGAEAEVVPGPDGWGWVVRIAA